LLKIIGVLVLLLAAVPSSAAPLLDRLVIIVPASAGGGFDKTAQSVATALRAENRAQHWDRPETRSYRWAKGLLVEAFCPRGQAGTPTPANGVVTARSGLVVVVAI